MVQDSLECAGPQKHNGESPVYIHRMVHIIQLLFRMSSTKCEASTKHDDLPDGIRKNSCILRIQQAKNKDFHNCASDGPAH